jgi:hypothetical protein
VVADGNRRKHAPFGVRPGSHRQLFSFNENAQLLSYEVTFSLHIPQPLFHHCESLAKIDPGLFCLEYKRSIPDLHNQSKAFLVALSRNE